MDKKKYLVTYANEVIYRCSVTVEAEDEDKAIEQAKRKPPDTQDISCECDEDFEAEEIDE